MNEHTLLLLGRHCIVMVGALCAKTLYGVAAAVIEWIPLWTTSTVRQLRLEPLLKLTRGFRENARLIRMGIKLSGWWFRIPVIKYRGMYYYSGGVWVISGAVIFRWRLFQTVLASKWDPLEKMPKNKLDNLSGKRVTTRGIAIDVPPENSWAVCNWIWNKFDGIGNVNWCCQSFLVIVRQSKKLFYGNIRQLSSTTRRRRHQRIEWGAKYMHSVVAQRTTTKHRPGEGWCDKTIGMALN